MPVQPSDWTKHRCVQKLRLGIAQVRARIFQNPASVAAELDAGVGILRGFSRIFDVGMPFA